LVCAKKTLSQKERPIATVTLGQRTLNLNNPNNQGVKDLLCRIINASKTYTWWEIFDILVVLHSGVAMTLA